MLRLLGIPVAGDDARRLISTLVADGSPDALMAAEQIRIGVERDYAVGLSLAERTAVLACSEDPPDGLVGLRGLLLCEYGGSPPICDDSPLWEPPSE